MKYIFEKQDQRLIKDIQIVNKISEIENNKSTKIEIMDKLYMEMEQKK